ncbi:hypothetical protein G6F36_012795 [Rhizopus arrhizus]|nr:hypothetical protein G6F36_012795 [Rhizopus arrhizus]
MKITWVMSMVCLVGVVSAAAIQGQEDGVKNKASPAEAKKEEVAEAFDMVKTVEDGSVGIAMMTKQTADRLQKQIQSSMFEKLCLALSQQEPYRVPTVGTPRRGAVAAILRWHGPHEASEGHKPRSITEFFEQDWLKEGGQAEILFMQRATRKGDRWSGHVAFPGGKDEPGESDEDTVCREVLEEIGIDLKSEDYLQLGQLDEREIASIKDNRLLMILVPFVYLQLTPNSPPFQLQTSEVASVRCKSTG